MRNDTFTLFKKEKKEKLGHYLLSENGNHICVQPLINHSRGQALDARPKPNKTTRGSSVWEGRRTAAGL